MYNIPLSVPSLQGNEWQYIKECLDTEGLKNRKIKEIGLNNIDNWKICLERYLKIYDK